MSLDFPTVLVVATFVTGLIWALDALIWAPRRKQTQILAEGEGSSEQEHVEPQGVKEPLLVEYAKSFFPIILIVLVIRSFLVEPFRIPSGSMMPTLLVGDFILVNKFTYGIRLPVINSKIIELGAPQRGDIIVFRYPENPSIDYIKRVVGVPGDQVRYSGKVLYINGKPMPQTFSSTYVGVGSGTPMTGASVLKEQLGELSHDILVVPNGFDRAYEFTVPQGEYFVMGDNRDNSRDSRFWGTVPDENLVGKAFMIWMNWDGQADGIAWGRIGSTIK